MKFVEYTDVYSDYTKMHEAANEIITSVGWTNRNQIGLKYRPGNSEPWFDATGSLFDRQKNILIKQEADFTEWNSIPPYLKTEILRLALTAGFKVGRARLMRLLPHTGLSVHCDTETRYHYVIETNPKSYICESDEVINGIESCARCYHLPADGQWYHLNTVKKHWVYNGGPTPRIHLVVCAL